MPISVAAGQKRNTRSQFGALCFRYHDGDLQFLLVTSRRSGRWIIPKGWPEDGLTPAEAAAKEAWEEAGATGKTSDRCIGVFTYIKEMREDDLPCVVMVFPVKVKATQKSYPEASMRTRKWFSRKGAAKRVQEAELKRLIKSFDPKQHL